MKNRFSSGKSKRNHYNWFRGSENNNPSKVTKYFLNEDKPSKSENKSKKQNKKQP